MVSVLVFIYLFSSSPSPQHHQQSHHHQQHVVENVYRTRNQRANSSSHFALHPLCGFGEIPWPFWPSFPKGSQPRPHSSCDTTDQAEEAPSLLQGCLRADSEASCHMQNTRKTHRNHHLHCTLWLLQLPHMRRALGAFPVQAQKLGHCLAT